MTKTASNLDTVLKGLSKDERKVAEDTIAKLRATFEDKLAARVEKDIEKQKAKSELAKLTESLDKEIRDLQKQRKEMALRIKELRNKKREIKAENK